MATAKRKTRTITRYVRKARRRARSITIPLAVVAGFVPALGYILSESKTPGGWERALKVQVPKSFLAFNPVNGEWGKGYFHQGLGPIALGCLVHWLVGTKLGVNRFLSRARVPVVRL